ncbi:MAG: hypothetical protein ABL951_13965 [Alphaproteobacteria bacterium]
MTLRELSEEIGTFFVGLEDWFSDLLCKLGFASLNHGSCHLTDWRDLTLGQAVLLVFIFGGIVLGVFEKVHEAGADRVKAWIIGVLAGLLTAWIEIYLADNSKFDIVNAVPWFPFGLLLAFLLICLPVIIGSLVYNWLSERWARSKEQLS